MFTFSILHTSARPSKWLEIYRAWKAAADSHSDFEYVLVTDERWGFRADCRDVVENLEWRDQDVCIPAKGRRCYVDGVNRAASVSKGRILITIADDQYPCPGWDTAILNYISANAIDINGHFAIRVHTGTPDEIKKNITVAPIVSRARYRDLGYIFYPGYESMCADNDLSEHAQQDGVFFEAPTIHFPHRHPFFTDGVKMDDAYAAQNREHAYQLGINLLGLRRHTRFGLGWDPKGHPVPAETKEPGKKRIAVCVPGEMFSVDWVGHWMNLQTYLMQNYDVYPIQGYCSQVHVTREVLAREAIKTGADYVLWIDDDNLVSVDVVTRLINVLDTMEGIDAVFGWCWIERMPGQFFASCGNFGIGSQCNHFTEAVFNASDNDLLTVEFSGFPVVLMRRETLEDLGQNSFAPILDADHPYGFISEDTSFCRRALDKHLTFVVDRKSWVPHMKVRSIGQPYHMAAPTVTYEALDTGVLGKTNLPAAELTEAEAVPTLT